MIRLGGCENWKLRNSRFRYPILNYRIAQIIGDRYEKAEELFKYNYYFFTNKRGSKGSILIQIQVQNGPFIDKIRVNQIKIEVLLS